MSIITVENLSKKYIIGHQKRKSYTALRDILASGTGGLAHKAFYVGFQDKADRVKNDLLAFRPS